ncbi:putative phage tail protein [Escherichia coli]|uniref:Putative phage tail protein n=1 Tax=Escherichia coli TaxID=562 RepID=A0A376P2N2_ECOLX|nr:putative phage tail protein [Escherichia coli]
MPSRNTAKPLPIVLTGYWGQVQTLAYDDECGRLVLGKPGTGKAATALVLGENILSCDTERSIRERFSEYQVSGQRPGNDDDFGEATIAAIRQTIQDSGVTRYRPLLIQQSGTATTATCKARCEFEARQRLRLPVRQHIRFRAGGRAVARYGVRGYLSSFSTR